MVKTGGTTWWHRSIIVLPAGGREVLADGCVIIVYDLPGGVRGKIPVLYFASLLVRVGIPGYSAAGLLIIFNKCIEMSR